MAELEHQASKSAVLGVRATVEKRVKKHLLHSFPRQLAHPKTISTSRFCVT